MATLSTLVVKLVGETGHFTAKMDEAAKKTSSVGKLMSNTFDELGGIVGGAAKIAGGVAVAGLGALTAGLGASIKAASDAQAGYAQLDAVLKSTGGAAGVTKKSVLDLATALSKSTRFSKAQTVETENMLLTFTKIGQEVFPEATRTVLDMATAMGGDPQQAAIQLGKALNDPISGVSALAEVGVTFTEQQKKLIKSLVDTGDVAGAQKIILAELKTEFGGSAEAAGRTFAGSLDILKNNLMGIAESIGGALMPLLTTVAQQLNAVLASPALQQALQGLQDFFASPAMSQFLQMLGNALVQGLQAVVGFINTVLLPAFNAIIPFLKDVLAGNWEAAWQKMYDFVKNIDWGALVQGILNIIGGIWSGIGQVLAKPIADARTTVWMILKVLEHDFTVLINSLITGVNNFVATAWEALSKISFLPGMQVYGAFQAPQIPTLPMPTRGVAPGENPTGITVHAINVGSVGAGYTPQQAAYDITQELLAAVRAQGFVP
jgi:hypothetical protein